MSGDQRTLYELINVDPGCSLDDLRAAYRSKAREIHPDVSGLNDAGRSMAALNEAWRTLSDPELREEYDRRIVYRSAPRSDPATTEPPSTQPPSTQPPSTQPLSKRDAWVVGVQAQIFRLATTAGKSATQTLLLRSPRGTREDYDVIAREIVEGLGEETPSRVRSARAAGAAPLDLGVAATLIGIRTAADRTRRQGSLGITTELLMKAELLDRMWDVLAHELPTSLEIALGSNPHVARALA